MLGQDFSGEQAAAWGLANAALEDGATQCWSTPAMRPGASCTWRPRR